jgi:hypothetical protein
MQTHYTVEFQSEVANILRGFLETESREFAAMFDNDFLFALWLLYIQTDDKSVFEPRMLQKIVITDGSRERPLKVDPTKVEAFAKNQPGLADRLGQMYRDFRGQGNIGCWSLVFGGFLLLFVLAVGITSLLFSIPMFLVFVLYLSLTGNPKIKKWKDYLVGAVAGGWIGFVPLGVAAVLSNGQTGQPVHWFFQILPILAVIVGIFVGNW